MIERSIWFFGPSAAGKCTLIRAIESDQAQPLRVQLQLGSAVELCTESLDGGMSRDRLAAAIVRHHRSGLAQLIKGRSRDIWDEFPQLDVPGQLARLLPNCQQELLFIWAHPAELSRRCRARAEQAKDAGDEGRSAYWSTYSEEVCKREHDQQIDWVSSLGLPILWVRNEDDQLGIGEQP